MLGERIPAPQALEWGLINRRRRRRRVRRRGATRCVEPPRRRPDALLRRHQAPAQRLALRAAWTSSSSSRPQIQQEMAASGDFVEGVHGVPREARGPSSTGAEPLAPGAAARRRRDRIPAALRPRRSASPLPSPSLLAASRRRCCSPAAPSPACSPPSRAARRTPTTSTTLYRIVFVVAVVVLRRRRGRAALLARQVPRAQGRASPAQIHGNTRLEIGWTRRRRA